MLYLHPPYYMYEGVVVAPDYNDPTQFYYFPNRPHIAVDDGHPAIHLLVYKANLDELTPEEEQVAGFLYFDTTLEWPEETLKKVAQKIQDDRDLETIPRLSPLLFRSGNVRLIFLDKTTAPPDGGGAAPVSGDRWVVSLECSGVPSLYGDNRAIFSAVLTKEATQLIYNAFDGFIPAGVVYDLSFVGMQRAFNVHVNVDWEQVYHFLDEKFAVDLFFLDIDIEKVVSEMEEKKLIEIVGTLEGIGEEGMESEFNAVRKELKEFVLDKFFKPVPCPDKQEPGSVTDKIVEFAADLRNLGTPSVGYSRLEMDSTEIRKLDIDYTVYRAVERKIAPQAHISMFFDDFTLTRDQVVTVVNGYDDFWRTVEFSVQANANFEGDGISGLDVDVAYGSDREIGPSSEPTVSWSTELLTKDVPTYKKSAWFDPIGGNQFSYHYKVHFKPDAVPGQRLELLSGWRNDRGSTLVISPNDLYQKRQIEFQLVKNFPNDLYPQAQIEVEYTDPDTGWTFRDSAVVDSTSSRANFSLRARREAPVTISYRYLFVQAGAPLQTDWQTTDSDLVLIMDPRPNVYRVSILVAGDRSKIQELLLNLRYEDPVDGHAETKFVRLTNANINEPQEWVFAPADYKHHCYTYNQMLMDTDGNIIATGTVQDDRPTLPVGVIYAKRWEVRPELVGPDLGNGGLEKVKLNLHYRDDANGVVVDKQMVFTQPGVGEPWPLELKDPSARSYTYEVTYMQLNGFERKIGPFTSNQTFLVISSVPPA